MNKTFTLLLLFYSFNYIGYAKSSFETLPSWVETFKGKGFPNPEKWTVSDFFSTQHFAYYNNSLKNVRLNKGKLNLTIRKDSIKQYAYSSGRIVSKRTFQYGKIVFRAKCPVTKGVWNAIWLWNKVGKGYFGELDIMEQIGCWGKLKYQINTHLWGTFSGKSNNHKEYPYYVNLDISKWHIYTLEWYEDRMILFVDHKKVHQVNKSDLDVWPFNQHYNLVIALAYGGNWAGACGLEDDKLPQTLQVDWIKYYPLKNKYND